MTEHTSASLGGIGQSVKRKEDPRFIQGKGNYVEDIYLHVIALRKAADRVKGGN